MKQQQKVSLFLLFFLNGYSLFKIIGAFQDNRLSSSYTLSFCISQTHSHTYTYFIYDKCVRFCTSVLSILFKIHVMNQIKGPSTARNTEGRYVPIEYGKQLLIGRLLKNGTRSMEQMDRYLCQQNLCPFFTAVQSSQDG